MKPFCAGLAAAGGLLALALPAAADVNVRAPFVRVNVGPGVQVAAPFVRVNVPPAGPAVIAPPPGPVIVAPGSPPPVVLPSPTPLPVQEVVIPSRPMTHYEFARAFVPLPGTYEVVLLHSRCCEPVRVCFTLPPGCVCVRAERHALVFDYGRREVVVRFALCGKVRVRDF
jgi:hypothetical protein